MYNNTVTQINCKYIFTNKIRYVKLMTVMAIEFLENQTFVEHENQCYYKRS